MEGIPVKISEKYKPPRKITLPGCVINRLNHEPKFEMYEFTMERMVVEQMSRLKALSPKPVVKEPAAIIEQSDTKDPTINETQSEQKILTPVPIASNNRIEPSRQEGQINLSDFENDTSSPFDNEELKTINDLEELAHVLGTSSKTLSRTSQQANGYNHPTTSHWGPNYGYAPEYSYGYAVNGYSPTSVPLVNKVSSTANYSLDHRRISSSHLPQYSSYSHYEPEPQPEEQESEKSKILKNLQDRLREIHVDSQSSQSHIHTPPENQALAAYPPTPRISQTAMDSPPNPFPRLSPQEQALSTKMSEMGFPLARSARAVERFGLDEAKVIEFLLLVQSLVDQNHPETRVEKALEVNNYSENETRLYLQNLVQIMELGFKEENVIAALARSENDRGKALELLIS